MSTPKIKKRTPEGPVVNYVGDGRLLSAARVRSLAVSVIQKHWRHPGTAPGNFELDINLVSSAMIRKINREYLDKDRPTDVIAFSFMEGDDIPEDVPHLGQILISRSAVREQAFRLGHSRREELRLLIIHGLLHIAGWKEGEEIQKCQEKIKKQTDRQAL